jgi:hypothetical protein
MTKHFYIAIMLLFAASQQCSAMEKLPLQKTSLQCSEMETTIVHEITSVARPTSVFFSKNNTITVFGTDTYVRNICSIYDCFTKEKATSFDPSRIKKNNYYKSFNINSCKEQTLEEASHPTGPITAFFNNADNIILYWDTLAQQPITFTRLNEFKTKDDDFLHNNSDYHRIDFSHDGTKLVVALENKCLVLEVPFEVLCNKPCNLGTQQKAIYTIFGLYNNNCLPLPQDIVHFLIKDILQLAQLPTFHIHSCCKEQNYNVSIGFIQYTPYYREHFHNNNRTSKFCSFCGNELPTSLKTQWHQILKKDYGLEDPLNKDTKSVPQEFWTEEWWKKRGL